MVTLNAPGADAAATAMAQEALDAFATGAAGQRPSPAAVKLAAEIANAALSHTAHPEVTLDIDGALSFDLRTPGGYLIFAELTPDGGLDATVFDWQDTPVQRMPSPADAELIAWFLK